jgi:endonuclease YncB( thermonuclease family)
MWIYKADLVRVIDGDTVVLRLHKEFSFDIDFGFYIKENLCTHKSVELPFRLLGIDAPEVVGSEKAAGLASKDALEKLLRSGELTATTYKPDKYGRWLATIEIKQSDGYTIDAADYLVKNGFAEPYMV